MQPDRAALEHENWIAFLTGVASMSRTVEVRRVGGALSLRSWMGFDWFNQVLIERPDATAADVLAAAGPPANGPDGRVIRLREGTDDRFVPDVRTAGWAVAGSGSVTPGMVAFPIDDLAPGGPALPRFQIRRLTDTAGVDDHRAAVAAGFGVTELIAGESAGYGLLDVPDCTLYAGYEDGVPVTSGMGWRTGRVIGVYSISTAPEARRRGYGEAMTARVVADGIAAGCDVAALQASEVGRPIYERLGFRVEVPYIAYTSAKPPPGDAS